MVEKSKLPLKACKYLKIDLEYFEELLEKGSLDGTYVKIEERYIFIKGYFC